MPIGAFRLNSLALSSAAAAAVTQALNTALSTSNDYWRGNDMAYLGNDSSGRPVFCTGFTKVTTQYPTLIMFRVNLTDLTITKGSEYTVDGTNTAVYVSVSSERDGAGLRTSSGFTDYGYVTWARNAANTGTRAAAFSYSLDNLTLTLGTSIALAGTTGGQSSGHYIGNNRVVGITNGGNNGNFLVQNWATRTAGSTTLTKNAGADNSVLGFYGQGGGYNTKGMSTDRWIVVPMSGNNGHGWFASAIRTNGSTGMVGVDYNYNNLFAADAVFNSEGKIAQLNNSTRFISACGGGFGNNTIGAIKAFAGTVTWNTGATAPTMAVGTAVTLESNVNGRFGLCEGTQDGEAFFIFVDNNDGLKIKFKKLTVSTNTISQSGYAVLSTIGNTQGYFVIDATRMVQVGTDWYMLLGMRNSTTGTVDVAVVKNPQSYTEPRTALTLTASGNATHSTAQSKFGGTSAYFDGTGDYITVSGVAGSTIKFNAGEAFTIESWVRHDGAQLGEWNFYWGLSDSRASGQKELILGSRVSASTGGVPRMFFSTDTTVMIADSGVQMATNTWYHLAVVRTAANYWYVFRDGTIVFEGSTGANQQMGNGNGLKIGALGDATLPHKGWIDEFRISNTARYTAAFTPSTSRFTNDANTLLLIHADSSAASPTFFDDNGGNFT